MMSTESPETQSGQYLLARIVWLINHLHKVNGGLQIILQ